LTAEEAIAWAIHEYGRGLVLSTSFQKEGMIILDLAVRVDPAITVITLDTGRLPEETYRMIETVRSRYGVTVEMVTPAAEEVARMTTDFGPNLFYRDVPSRMLCCQIRKVRPLERRLASAKAFFTGLRREQNELRANLPQIDYASKPVKIAPLAAWTAAEVKEYTLRHDVPVHPLYSAAYTSIGCAPCTRAVVPGESERAGRWWWELDSAKECGIHFTPDGRAVRQVDVLLEQVLAGGS
jgi:phosphoadenylyl-sulfate reductase (thioredoxin)